MARAFRGSVAIAACAIIACVGAAGALGIGQASGPARAAEAESRVAGRPVCFNAAETRELVKSKRLVEPFAALKSAAAQRKAEALSAKLCRIGDDFVYEITLLHRDGRLVHLTMEAANGRVIAHPPREPAPKN